MIAERARLVDILAVLSLTTDLATAFPFERGLRACLVADGLARALELDPPDHRAAFLASLVRAVGCGHASENAALFGDDIAFERFLVRFDLGDEAVAGAQLAAFETVVGAAAMQKFLAVAPTVGPVAVRASCEVAVALGTQLGLPAVVVELFGDVFERWDGRGLPNGRAGGRCTRSRGLSVSLSRRRSRTLSAELPWRARRSHGAPVVTWTRHCARCFSRTPTRSSRRSTRLTTSLTPSTPPSLLLFCGSPRPISSCHVRRLRRLRLKGFHLIGDSPHVTELALGAARLAGLDDVEDVRIAALLHDVGRAGS
jgi:hypothetical protein